MNLTDEQKAIVFSEESDMVSLAAAGGGKTHTVVSRLRRLLLTGTDPARILAITFTRRAAGEMKERLAKALGPTGSETVTRMAIGTCHARCYKIIQEHADKLGYRAHHLSVLDPDDSETLLKQVAFDLSYYDGQKWKPAQLSMKKAVAFVHQEPGTELESFGPKIDRALDAIKQEFDSRCRQMHAMTFPVILRQCEKLLTSCPEVLAQYRQLYQHICTDEAQDSGSFEFSLYEMFRGYAKSMFVVGDIRQSIYSWRGGRPELFRQWAAHEGTVIYDLTQCFRCPDSVIRAANKLIAVNGDIGKPMVGCSGREGLVETFPGRSADVVAKVQEIIAQGYAPGDIAVIARRHATLKNIAGKCIEAGLQFTRVGAEDHIFRSREFRLLWACVKLMANPRNNVAWLRVSDVLGLSAAQRSAIRGAAITRNIGEFQVACEQTELGPFTVIRDHDQQAAFVTTIDALRRSLMAFGFNTERSAAFWLSQMDDGRTVEDALGWAATFDPDIGDDYRPDNKITLITSHAAKGLEWPVVILADCNEGTWPSSQSIRKEDVTEERRGFFVGLTRAKKCAYLHYRRPEDQNAERGIQEPSRFLFECGAM